MRSEDRGATCVFRSTTAVLLLPSERPVAEPVNRRRSGRPRYLAAATTGATDAIDVPRGYWR